MVPRVTPIDPTLDHTYSWEPMLASIKRLLAHRRAPIAIAIIAVLLTLPTIGVGAMTDDYTHRLLLLPSVHFPGGPRGPWDLFHFISDDPAALRANMDRGFWPWWTISGYKLAFLRPLASLWHALDYGFWPGAHALMHAENIGVYAASVLLVALFYRRLLGATATAGLAALLFAVDDAHATVVSWVANRHAIISVAFGIATLLAHDHARRDGSKSARLLAPLAFAAAMLAGESGVSVLAYLFAYALFLEREPLRARTLSLVPYAAITVVWFAAYKLGGYGAAGGAFYIDPVGEFGDFALAVSKRLPALLAAQLALPPADLWMVMPPEKSGTLVAASVLVLLVVLGALFAKLRGDRNAAFFTLGMALCLLPACATWPSDRLLLFSGIGGFGLVALFLQSARKDLGLAARGLVGAVAGLFVLAHIVAAPLLLPLRGYGTGKMFHGMVERAIASLPADDIVKDRTLVVLSAPDCLIPNYSIAGRLIEGRPVPSKIKQLAVTGTQILTRKDDRTLSMTISEGFFQDLTSKVFRNLKKSPFHVGDRVELEGMTAEIISLTPDGERPLRVDFHFDRSLDDPSLVWIMWKETGFVSTTPPAPGEERTLPPIDFQKAING